MDTSSPLFSRKQLTALIIPLIIEQFLSIFVGMADTIMVSNAGEAAVSGVSLVDTLNVLLVVLFTALTAGGSVVVSQNLGAKRYKEARLASQQLLLSATAMALIMTLVALAGNYWILHLIFGNVALDVMESARIYFFIMAFSYPFLAIYNSCAAIFRSMGNSRISMLASLFMNLVNICGNALLVYGLHMGAAGVAIPSLVSRMLAAGMLLILLRNPRLEVSLRTYTLRFNFSIIKKLLAIGVPSSVENSIFQIGKLLVLSVVAGFGTSATTANAVSNSLAQFPLIPASAIGTAMITIIGQCMGAGASDQAVSYTKKLILLAHGILAATNLFMIVACPFLLTLYNLTPQTLETATLLVRFHSTCAIFLYPESFVLSNTLRASADVKYPMVVSIVSMWVWRVGFSYVLALQMNLGVFGVWVAMMMDWLCRSICFLVRFKKGTWKTKHLLA
ncbi:MAG TPA: MATE family efflux transporter [Candidatus Limivivens intestinipullorum]|uniref:Probable multidrug resistance protein NorM n=1 Tax=Candidatus Limivivens intestinipullorum TaxID=2840858 RepID=A0A9D1JKF5_9FIRM|nr:MATE family efflux transporter [Candidatus Limivivens intestinipullorum]